MLLVHRQWRWNTYGHTNPWAGHYTSGVIPESSFSEHFATAAKAAQAHTVASVSTTATVQVATTERTTDSPMQRQTSPGPAAMQTTANAMTTTSPTAFLLSLAGESTSRSTSDHGATHSSGGSTSGAFISRPSGGLTVSLPGTGLTAQSTATGSSSTAQPIATGSSANPTSSQAARRIGKGEIAAIVLGIVFALGVCGMVYYLWKRRAAGRRDSTFIQYPFSSDAATATMADVPHHALIPPNTPVEWDTHTDGVESPAATLTCGSPTGASGYGGGCAVYPLDEKSPSPSPSHNAFYPATTPFPRSITAFAFSFPMPLSPLARPPASPGSNSPIAPPPATHPQLPDAQTSMLPYAWDRPPPSSEYLPRTPDRRSTFRASWGTRPGPFPRRSSFGTVAATPIYSSGVPDVDRRPPSYSRY